MGLALSAVIINLGGFKYIQFHSGHTSIQGWLKQFEKCIFNKRRCGLGAYLGMDAFTNPVVEPAILGNGAIQFQITVIGEHLMLGDARFKPCGFANIAIGDFGVLAMNSVKEKLDKWFFWDGDLLQLVVHIYQSIYKNSYK
jgi:hypothetical protein